MISVYLHIGILLAVFVAALGFYFAVMMDRLHITYTQRYWITCVYFLLLSVVIVYIERDFFAPLVENFNLGALAVFAASLVSVSLLQRWARTHIKKPTAFIETAKNQVFLRLDHRYLISKGFEIAFQQIIVILLALLLVQMGFPLLMIMILFAVVFAIAHTPLIFYDQAVWGWYYTIFSFISGFVFPPLILTLNYGFVYSFLVHWFFYAVGGILFWIYHNKKVYSA